jgi:hypothetical protein
VLNAPGLLQALPASALRDRRQHAAQNVAFDRNAIQLVTRAPQMPIGPDGSRWTWPTT